MTVPHYVNEHQSGIRAIKSGWSNGKLSAGPYHQTPRGNATPEFFAHAPWLRSGPN